MHGTISKAQISRIWACAHALGLDEEMLYLLVPRGSISAMSREEASELIEHLERLRVKAGESMTPQPASDPHAATQEQKHFIYFLFGKLGWLEQPARVRGFLHKFAKVSAVEEIRDRKRASAIIEALKAIHRRRNVPSARKTG
jgi:hypothetical protein